MAFICYSLAVGLVAFAVEEPELFLWVVLLVATRVLLR
jgi:hypothetical protein